MEAPHGDPAAPVDSNVVSAVPAGPAANNPGPVPARPVCAAHPRQAAVTRCSSCGKQLCALCTFDIDRWDFCGDCALRQANSEEGRHLCPECGRSMPAEAVLCECGRTLEKQESAPPPKRRWNVPAGMCVNHPDSPAVVSCGLCARSICATCEFVLPGSVHVCPTCIEAQGSAEVSPKRKSWAYLSLGLAAWSTVLFALLMGGLFNSLFSSDGGDAFDRLITTAIFWPTVIGTGLALASREKRLKNSGLTYVALWWNVILGGIFLLLILRHNLG